MKTFGKYELLEEIGKGPAGTTYRACDQLSMREVAVKVLHSAAVSPEAKARLCRELTACSELQHPHVVKILDIGEVEGEIYKTTELLQGVDLRRHFAERRELSLVRKLKLIAQIYDGLALAHGRQITHGDIKPENIFLTDQYEAKILDFGIARLPLAPGREGMPNYLAPEQIMGQPGDARSDLFSVAVVLYELLVSVFPFQAPAGLIPREIVNTEPKRLRKLDPRIPEELERLVAAALAKDPQQRPQTAEVLAVSLCAIAEQLQRGQASPGSESASPPQPAAPASALADTAEMPCLVTMASAPAPLAASATAAAGATGGSTKSRDAERGAVAATPQAMPLTVCATSKPDAAACAATQPALDGALWTGKAERPASEVTRLSDTPKVPSSPPAPIQPSPASSSAAASPVVPKRPSVRRGIAIAAAAVLGIFIVAGLLSRQTSDATQSGRPVQGGPSVSTRPAEKDTAPPIQPSALPAAQIAVPTSQPERSAEKMLTEQVDALWESGGYVQAMKLVDAILAAEPGNAEAIAWKKKIRAAQDAEAALK